MTCESTVGEAFFLFKEMLFVCLATELLVPRFLWHSITCLTEVWYNKHH